jgi:hypothetical protein
MDDRQSLQPEDRQNLQTDNQRDLPNFQDEERQGLPMSGQGPVHTGVSGFSFLGLSDDEPPEDYDEPEPESHLQRNLALLVMSVAVILTAYQWRSIRAYTLGFADLHKDAPQAMLSEAQTAPIANDDADSGSELSRPPKTGSIEPLTGEDASRPGVITPSLRARSWLRPRQSTQAPPAMAQSQSYAIGAPATDLPQSGSDSPPNDASRSEASQHEVSQDEASQDAFPHDSAPQKRASPNESSESTSGSAGARTSAGASHVYRPDTRRLPSAPPAPGADEMNRAAQASDAEIRAAWLWRAVAKGNNQAPLELARMYEAGSGVTRSCDQAVVLLRAAANQGNEDAKLYLEQIRYRGCTPR